MSTLHERLLDRVRHIDALHGLNRHVAVEAVKAALKLHSTHEGRCVECVEYCDCPTADECTHGNVVEPCNTKRAIAESLGVPTGDETP